MANSASDLATNSVSLDSGGNKKVPALGDGTLLPGALCTITNTSGVIDGCDQGAVDKFIGILEKRYDKTIDEAPASGEACDLILPENNKKYIVRVDSANSGAGNPGDPMELSATSNGEIMDAVDLTDNCICRLARAKETGDDFAIVYWGGL